ncbi:MAG: hypothetical protein VB817_06510, partial [Pirellulaceae bacterium]
MKSPYAWKAVLLLLGCYLLSGTLASRQSDQQLGADEKAASSNARPAKAEPRQVYMRVKRDEQGKPLSLQTSIVSFVSGRGRKRAVSVDLIGAVHVGDQAYYETLNKKFQDYEVVLYELVAPEGTRIPKGGRQGGGGAIGGIQNGMSSILNLAHQLNHIDYTVKNLVHADMSP